MKNGKRKILVVTGTRAEYGLLKSTIDGILSSKILSLCLVATGMHTLKKHGYTINDIKKDGVPINHIVPIAEGDDMLGALSKEINGIKDVCLREKPAAILVLGDRDEPFAAAIVGGHLKIPVLHIHGGDVTGYMVDDYIRHAITKFSHLHFTASKKSFERVVKLGEEKWRVFKVGTPGLDNLRQRDYFSRNQLAEKLGLDAKKKWLLVLQHSTPLDKISVLRQIGPTLRAVAEVQAEKIIIYPNNDTGSETIIKEINNYKNRSDFHIYENFDRNTYLSLLKYSDALVGNSSSGVIEAGFFNLPVVNIGNRQLGRECGQGVIHTGYSQKQIKTVILRILASNSARYHQGLFNPYGAGRAGEKIVKIIEKYIDRLDLFYKKFTHI